MLDNRTKRKIIIIPKTYTRYELDDPIGVFKDAMFALYVEAH